MASQYALLMLASSFEREASSALSSASKGQLPCFITKHSTGNDFIIGFPSVYTTLALHHVLKQLIIRSKKHQLSLRRNQDFRAHECAPLSWHLASLPDKTCSCGAESKPTSRAWGWQNTVPARGSARTVPCSRTIVETVRSKWMSNQSYLSPS